MGDVYSVEDPYPSEGPPPAFSGGESHDGGPDGAFGGWLTPMFGTADEEKRDSESLERLLLQSGCWNTTEDGKELEVECRCSGDDIVDVPGNLTRDVSRISIVRAGLVTLRRGALQPYASTLKDLVLMNVEELESIEDHAFENLTELRTIYIDHAPKLRNISDQVFGEHLPRLRILRIVHTGLHKIPNLSDLRVDSILHMIDLENNQIERVYSNSVKVRSEQFLLNYNLIAEVEDFAFNNSEIAKLSLKGNRRLCTIGPSGFVGLQSLRDLDLSETSITQMPTRGLQMLEILRLQDTETLKVIPSVYNFQFLTEAWLTYPYHCCAFKYPATHDPKEHAKHEEILDGDVPFSPRAPSGTPPPSPYPPVTKADLASQHIVEGIRSGCSDKGTAAPEVIVEEVEPFDEDRRVGRAPLARLSDAKEEDEGEFGKMVFYPDNKSRHVEPDWSALTASQRPHFPSNQFDPYHLDMHHSFHHELAEGTMATQHTPGTGNDQVAWLRTLFSEDGVFHQGTAPHTPSLISAVCGNLSRHPRTVECHPEPDAFNPCEDIMGNWWLRVSAWLMGILSLLGNIAVLFVLLSCQFRMSVSKFLMCNLAFADLSMGLYLMSILVMDARTIGVYFNHAIDWQEGPGCQIAGFLTVFASELSIFTLAMITSERWYAITYAMHLDRRLRVSTATKVMALGWVYAAVVASLPLVGISGYSKTSICLPMENRDLPGKIYVILLLVINGLAFILICACYGNIYYVIRKNSQERRNRARANNEKGDQGSPQWWGRTNVGHTNSDATVAKRMALLVFTDFACKAPIAFFGLTAMAGMPLIDVTHAKILLVFFYPLNSCANPFLYALLTKQYRRDLFTMLSRHGLFANKAARYKGAFPGVNNEAANKAVTGVARNPKADRKTTGCWQNCSDPNRRNENHISFLQGFYPGAACNHTEPVPFVSQPSSQRGSFLTQMSSVDGGFKVAPANPLKIRPDSDEDAVIAVTIELDEMDRKALTNPPSESEEVSTDRPHSDGCESYPLKSIKDSRSSWSRSGSPHPIRSSMTRLAISDDQEEILRRALARVSKSSPSSPNNMVEPSSNI
ncbi:lutropin-choriogonadotropic hormone receptor-like [Hetaerina americana]|uniref:lutropin-choriogonadotropic hormone receptor-like n=1 Tax=Hetaerina americana TaxID=62018 RepID=UPI003A7F5A56